MPEDVLPISFDNGKGITCLLKPVSFWRTFNNLQHMFRNDSMHLVTLSHPFHLGMDRREAQQMKREDRDARLLSLGKELIPSEPVWMIHEDQDLMDDHDPSPWLQRYFEVLQPLGPWIH